MKCPCCGQDMPDTSIKIDYRAILEGMNTILGTKYRFTETFKKIVHARYNDGFRTEDFLQVCRNMKAEWGNDPKMLPFLRPNTLFSGKMDGYLNRVQPALTNNGLDDGMVW